MHYTPSGFVLLCASLKQFGGLSLHLGTFRGCLDKQVKEGMTSLCLLKQALSLGERSGRESGNLLPNLELGSGMAEGVGSAAEPTGPLLGPMSSSPRP
jgi:hypothetical protein